MAFLVRNLFLCGSRDRTYRSIIWRHVMFSMPYSKLHPVNSISLLGLTSTVCTVFASRRFLPVAVLGDVNLIQFV